jgi:glutamate racemase
MNHRHKSDSADAARILVFDSGVGALSVIQSIRGELPQLGIVYCSDNRFFPYGTKPEEQVRQRVPEAIKAVLHAHPCDLVVIACNTASVVALDAVRSQISIPVVGVVPAIKPAAQMSQNKVIGLLATPITVQRAYTHRLIEEYAKDCRVILKGSSALVEMAEQKLRGFSIDPERIEPEIREFNSGDDGSLPDHIVLGCTHFPLLEHELRQSIGRPVQLVDSGVAIARRVGQLLSEAGHRLDSSSHRSHNLAIFTQSTAAIAPLADCLRKFGFMHVEIVDT